MYLTGFLISFFGFHEINLYLGQVVPALGEIEVMEEACVEMITYSIWKSPGKSSETFFSRTQVRLQGGGQPIRLQEDTI